MRRFTQGFPSQGFAFKGRQSILFADPQKYRDKADRKRKGMPDVNQGKRLSTAELLTIQSNQSTYSSRQNLNKKTNNALSINQKQYALSSRAHHQKSRKGMKKSASSRSR